MRDFACAVDRRVAAVLAEAGCGKTQLAAGLTAPAAGRPAGILLLGCDLQAGQSLDTLAGRSAVIQGIPARSMEALAAALDAAGRRAGRRLPLFIDGLNEAEDPRNWRGTLAALTETLRPFPYVLVVCTVRPAFADEALPEAVERLDIPGFEHDVGEAVRRYFRHYLIDPADADLPWGMLNQPLTLRLFCEVTNARRAQVVGVEAMPGSLTALFERHLEQAAERIAELAPRRNRYYAADIRDALAEIGVALWNQRSRRLGLADLRRRLRDDGRPWDESLVRALEQDGVLLRDPGDDGSRGQQVSVVYDLLAGHLIADALLDQHGRAGIPAFLQDPHTTVAVHGTGPDRHTLGSDILAALVGLAPRRAHGLQVWRLIDEPLRAVALQRTAMLDAQSLDADTVDELAGLAVQPVRWGDGLFRRLHETRGSAAHPLNAEFLDRVLRPMAVAARDMH